MPKKPAPKQKKKLPAKKKSKPDYAELAKKGDVEALFALIDLDSESDNDRLAYKWLSVASDYGHEEADALIGDVMEVSSLRYDDDQYETASAHWEIAVGCLTGDEGLPIDLKKAKDHLGWAFEIHSIDELTDGTQRKSVLARVPGPAKKLLQTAIATAGQGGDDEAGD